jgi:hypothetical protein
MQYHILLFISCDCKHCTFCTAIYNSKNTYLLTIKEQDQSLPRILSSTILSSLGQGKVHPCTGRTAHKGSRGTALLFHDHDTRRGWGFSVTPRSLFASRARHGTHCTGGWVGPTTGLDRCKKSRPIRIWSPDRPARSQSLCRLGYPAHYLHLLDTKLLYLSYVFDTFFLLIPSSHEGVSPVSGHTV